MPALALVIPSRPEVAEAERCRPEEGTEGADEGGGEVHLTTIEADHADPQDDPAQRGLLPHPETDEVGDHRDEGGQHIAGQADQESHAHPVDQCREEAFPESNAGQAQSLGHRRRDLGWGAGYGRGYRRYQGQGSHRFGGGVGERGHGGWGRSRGFRWSSNKRHRGIQEGSIRRRDWHCEPNG
jgi:hypothetical protein